MKSEPTIILLLTFNLPVRGSGRAFTTFAMELHFIFISCRLARRQGTNAQRTYRSVDIVFNRVLDFLERPLLFLRQRCSALHHKAMLCFVVILLAWWCSLHYCFVYLPLLLLLLVVARKPRRQRQPWLLRTPTTKGERIVCTPFVHSIIRITHSLASNHHLTPLLSFVLVKNREPMARFLRTKNPLGRSSFIRKK